MATPGDKSGSAAAKGPRLRYPLRSAGRGKVAPPTANTPPSGSAPRRAKPSSDVTRSMYASGLSSVKHKSAKPPERHSIPAKPGASPRPRLDSDNLAKFDTPTSKASAFIEWSKFSTLSSISYWMAQIRLAEATSKHSISLGFFKLALESECELLGPMREELKAYIARHGLATELENPVKDILQVYDIAEDFEKLKIYAESLQETTKPDKAALSATNVAAKGSPNMSTENEDVEKESTQWTWDGPSYSF